MEDKNLVNVYAPPVADVSVEINVGENEMLRNKYLKREANIKSLGTLYFIGGLVVSGMFVFRMLVHFRLGGLTTLRYDLLSLLFLLVLSVFNFWLGFGLRRLKSAVRIPAIILNCLCLLAFPVGTLFAAIMIYMLSGEKGAYVFSDEYKQVMADTPHIKYRTSKGVWIFLIVLIVAVVVACVVAANAP
jgi:hypothetical protein